MLRYVTIGVVGLAGLSVPAFGQAAQDDAETVRLDTVEVVGLRPVKKDDVTVSVTTLDAATLAIRDTPFVADQLRQVPGTGVSRSGAFGALTQIRLRGAEANQTLVLVDGIEVSNPVTGETDFGLWSSLPVSRIEVARGEQSVIYGPDAIGGVVSITTADPTGVTGNLEVGSQDTYRGQVDIGTTLGGLKAGFNASGFTTNGVDTAGLDGEDDGSSSYAFLGRASYEDERFTASGIVRFSSSEVDSDPDSDFDGLLEQGDNEADVEQWLIGGTVGTELFGIDHRLRATWTRIESDTFALGVDESETIGERFKIGWSPSVTLSKHGEHTFSGIIEYQDENFAQEFTDTTFGDPAQSQSVDEVSFGGEYRYAYGGFDANASVRHDINSLFADTTTWRVGAAYDVDLVKGRIRGSVGEGAKAPTFTELFGFIPEGFLPNPDLIAETSFSWEIGWDQAIGENAEVSVTYFNAELENEIFTAFGFDPDTSTFTTQAQNSLGESDRQGVEVDAAWRVSPEVTLRGAFSYIDSDDAFGAAEIRVPEFTGSVSVDWAPENQPWRVGAAIDVVGEQPDTNFGTFETVTLPAYVLASATASYDLTDRVALTVRGENLFDEEIVDVFGFNAPGIGGFIGLRIR